MSNNINTIGVIDPSKVDLNKAQNAMKANYSFKEPKTGFFATVFPSESTWHPLYDNNVLEVARHLASINDEKNDALENEIDDDKRKAIIRAAKYKTNMLEKIVKEAPIVHAKSRLIFSIVAFIIILIVIFWLYTTGVMSGLFALGAISIAAALPGYFLVKTLVIAPGDGENQWSDYSSRINSYRVSGDFTGAALAKLEESYLKDKANSALNTVTPFLSLLSHK
jgi:hypothetical protein